MCHSVWQTICLFNAERNLWIQQPNAIQEGLGCEEHEVEHEARLRDSNIDNHHLSSGRSCGLEHENSPESRYDPCSGE